MAKLSDLVKKYKVSLSEVHKLSCLELGNRVQEATPVDKGRARQGWIGNGAPRLGKIYRFTNNVEYITALEYGHSDQAANGMVRINTRSFPDIVRQKVNELRN